MSHSGTTFRVTHPFHPRYGQEIGFYERRKTWGDDRVYFHEEGGRLKTLPVGWTSVSAPDPFVVMAAGTSRPHFSALIELTALVEHIDVEAPPAKRSGPRRRGTPASSK